MTRLHQNSIYQLQSANSISITERKITKKNIKYFEDILQEVSDFGIIRINLYASKIVKKRYYFIIPVHSYPEITNKVLFTTI